MESLSLSFSYQPGEYARALRRVQISKLRAVRDAVIAASVLGLAAFLWLLNGYSWVVGVMLVSILFFGLLLGFGVFVVPALVSRNQKSASRQQADPTSPSLPLWLLQDH